MASETETLALHLGTLPVRRDRRQAAAVGVVAELDGATKDAIEFAVARGWLIVQGGHSICLTDTGRRLPHRSRAA
jgi:hypothetical protein